jgi:hypothetical protein
MLKKFVEVALFSHRCGDIWLFDSVNIYWVNSTIKIWGSFNFDFYGNDGEVFLSISCGGRILR